MVTEEFIKEHKQYLAYVYKQKDSRLTKEDIDDLVQDTFEKVTLYKDYYDESKGTIRNWLNMMCVHVYDRHKRGSLQIDEIANDYTQDEVLFDSNEYYYRNNQEEVDHLISMLPKSQSNIVHMKLVLGYSHKEISAKLYTTETACRSTFKRGMDNLKKLINSEEPEKEVLKEAKILKPSGDRPFAGDWAWRYGESSDRRNSKVIKYTPEECAEYCQKHNLNYNGEKA